VTSESCREVASITSQQGTRVSTVSKVLLFALGSAIYDWSEWFVRFNLSKSVGMTDYECTFLAGLVTKV
jgi:hypothetical protein